MENFLSKSLLCLTIIMVSACNNFINVEQPRNSITGDAVFREEATASAAVNGCYARLPATSLYFANGGSSIFLGMYADEITTNLSAISYRDFANSTVVGGNSLVYNNFWRGAYETIYQVNRCLAGLQNSPNLSSNIKAQLQGECYFLRAFCYWHLVNLFGGVPLAISVNYETNALLPQSPPAAVYIQMKADLLEARALLSSVYPSAGKFRANKSAATALLARLCLYQEQWADAETYSTEVIESGLYILPTLANTFLENSSEAIWQLTLDGQFQNTQEGSNFVPLPTGTSLPSYPLTDNLRLAFEVGDQRFTNWVGSKMVGAKTHYFPAKYKNRGTDPKTEQPIVLRLGEQYLIRAEARAKQDNFTGAIDDIRVIRDRAGLTTNISTSDQTVIVGAIMKERRIELFAEYGHRWFDLKRSGNLDIVLNYKPGWQSTDALLPIPQTEINLNVKLVQNPGY